VTLGTFSAPIDPGQTFKFTVTTIRQDMLDLHGMAHNLINQDYGSGTPRDESIGELAERLTGDILECIAHLEQAYEAVKPLESLLTDPDEEWEEEQVQQSP
jgi:hypothetical protein